MYLFKKLNLELVPLFADPITFILQLFVVVLISLLMMDMFFVSVLFFLAGLVVAGVDMVRVAMAVDGKQLEAMVVVMDLEVVR